MKNAVNNADRCRFTDAKMAYMGQVHYAPDLICGQMVVTDVMHSNNLCRIRKSVNFMQKMERDSTQEACKMRQRTQEYLSEIARCKGENEKRADLEYFWH